MHEFHYRQNELYCEDVPVKTIAQEVGTPFYLYSAKTLLNHYRAYDSAFASIPHIITFAMKANSNLAILRLFAREGGGADIVSAGELFRALQAGVDPRKINFAGVGKTAEEIRYALESNILMFNVESSQELRKIDEVAGSMGKKARVALRVNPNVDPKTHPYISTGMKKHKFGIGIDKALEEYKLAASLKHVEVAGIHQHIGSQLTETAPYVDALRRLLGLVEELKKLGIDVQYVNIGGGLGITYEDETPPLPKELATAIGPLVKDLKCVLIMEPGRALVGNAGILVTKVLYTKEGEAKKFVIVDAAMNDLIRPSLYGAFHLIQPLIRRGRKTIAADVVGPICESADFLAKDREMEECLPEEYLAVMSAGAYGFAMASNYNARPRTPEILVHGDRFDVVRERETYADLIKGEHIPDFLK
ncbi:MAG TPA: diaminopimelate decarboxylase [Nitrospiria bacterium]|jgi:diaminopimelate decarboxylase|nr:diaminopimelate decarboxylase [Nitrospiria bacterium]